MNLSTKSRYGLRILICLSKTYGTGIPQKGKDIARDQGLTEPYFEQIIIKLKASTLVKTIRGCNGGYLLNRSPETISLLEIVEIFEGPIELVKCRKGSSLCSRHNDCDAQSVWSNLSKTIRKELAQVTLASILKESAEAEEQPEYVI
ncbi:MAG: Rrf2 family transcriptional regulator [Lentisphaerae bacterium]|nr:Rrf2 family transcriptional regulator [Lentisphaerota bacterium]MCP4103115.1 Rrf2 family transcriptional regulator [Lentisphaerota bacterium]